MPSTKIFDAESTNIIQKLFANRCIILTAGTGLGKTTRVPLYAAEVFTMNGLNGNLKLDYETSDGPQADGRISNQFPNNKSPNSPITFTNSSLKENSIVLVAQPKKKLITAHDQSFLNENIKDTTDPRKKVVSCFSKQTGPYICNNYSDITFVTSGFLRQIFKSDPTLSNLKGENSTYSCSCLIIDEAHERSIDIDMVLAMAKNALALNPDFKVIIMSATIKDKIDLFQRYFFNADYIHIEKDNFNQSQTTNTSSSLSCPNGIRDNSTSHQICIKYLSSPSYNYIFSIITTIVDICNENRRKKIFILAFVTSTNEFQKIKDGLKLFNNEIFESFRGNIIEISSKNDGQGRLEDTGLNKNSNILMLATNVIESSVTLKGLDYVIDCGLSKQVIFSPLMNGDIEKIATISQASAEQRKGRVGRIQPGTCNRLYTNDFFDNAMPKSTPPEILTNEIESILVNLLNIGYNYFNFDFIEPPTQLQTTLSTLNLINYNLIPDDFTQLSNRNSLTEFYNERIKMFDNLSNIKVNNQNISLLNILKFLILEYSDDDAYLSCIASLQIYIENQNSSLFKNLVGSQIEAIINLFDGDSLTDNDNNYTANRNDLLADIKNKIGRSGGNNSNSIHSTTINNEIHNKLVAFGNVCYNGYMYADPISYAKTSKTIYFRNQIRSNDKVMDINTKCSYVNFSLRENNYKIDILSYEII